MNSPLNNAIQSGQAVLRICGARGTRMVCGPNHDIFGANTNCYAFNFGKNGLIVDGGTGLANALEFLKGCEAIDIVLTHFHLDHISGLLSYTLLPDDHREFKLYGHAEEGTLKELFGKMFRPPFWPVPVDTLGSSFTDIKAGDEFAPFEGVTVEATSSNHPNGCLLYNIKFAGKKLCFAFDYEFTGDFGALRDFARDADLLFFDGTLDDSEYKDHVGWGHSTWQGGIKLAGEAAVKKLIITHHSPSRDDDALQKLEEIAQQTMPNCEFAREGKEYDLW